MPRNLGLEPPTSNPGSKNPSLPYPQPSYKPRPPHPAPAQTPITLNREFSGEIRTIIILLIITLKLSAMSKKPRTLRTVKLQATSKCADINCNNKPLTQGHLKLPCNRPSTVTQTLAKTLEYGITASSPIKH